MPASEQGISRERYMLIPRVLIFVTRGNFVLLLRGAPDKRLWANLYNGLGGHVEQGEDVLTAARRELLEEAGIETELRLCGMLLVDTGRNPGVAIYVFRGEYDGEVAPSSEEGTLEWVAWDAAASLPCVEDLPVLLEALRRQKAGEAPFSARSFYDEGGHLVVEFA